MTTSVPSPSTVVEWREFLRRYNSEFLNSSYLRRAEAEGRAKWLMTEGQRQAGWLGHEPASEEAILATEARLGVALPPTYRNFLLAGNGWSSMAYSLDLVKVEEIGWFSEADPGLLAAWSEPGMEDFADWVTLLKRCVLISNDDGGSGGNWLLHVDGNAENSEWTAYEWWPGDGSDPEPFDNFAVLVDSLWKATAEPEDKDVV
ncbi:SMI1/KNR4 family protein [Amycolatopsis sp. EV170708-02-1]|uniref:SMI1/KNR4 family protein n=1 Tax=Amycolatopsis sp. EV170708-02-1 TaxID=2919322 RepID=UPI001F0C17B6|nr:SMI1/KNR4 family protein [Amycolatopsis sp. EV170708-02-1]UMP06940.1 SMI1/KNR4 family protein [Amycolatopsis sp. EV170708-02-1]